MKIKTASIVLLTTVAACGALAEERLNSSAIARPAIHPTNLLVRAQEANAQSEVDWFRSGPYVGASVGWAASNASESGIDNDLSDIGIIGEADLDDNDFAWKLYGGYRFEGPFALELSAVDLGTIESDIELTTLNVSLDQVAEEHPFSAKGASLTGTWYALDEQDYQVGLKGGLWWWDGEVEANGPGGARGRDSDTGLDVVYGLVGNYELGSGWALRGEVEHYRIDTDGVTFFSIGAQWTPQAASRRPAPVAYDEELLPSLLRRRTN